MLPTLVYPPLSNNYWSQPTDSSWNHPSQYWSHDQNDDHTGNGPSSNAWWTPTTTYSDTWATKVWYTPSTTYSDTWATKVWYTPSSEHDQVSNGHHIVHESSWTTRLTTEYTTQSDFPTTSYESFVESTSSESSLTSSTSSTESSSTTQETTPSSTEQSTTSDSSTSTEATTPTTTRDYFFKFYY
ncbi:unnamed protein product [Ambrosiozyma monospora]|uniref:Unnamed protein product n=1 Tax=Ambrosiozyma monospora TaxID=43982 RepID=A0ACB5U3H4_AMBMO|nr:unnamed protein product [Ambrosiozyma monospora]